MPSKIFLSTRDASHIQAKAQGGPNTAENMVFEDRQFNRARNYDYRAGRRNTPHMTTEELQAVSSANKSFGLQIKDAVFTGARAAGYAAALEGSLALLEETAEYRKGNISATECAQRVVTRAATSAAVGGGTFAGCAALCAASPAAAAALPAVTIGLAVFGAHTIFTCAKNAIEEHRSIKKDK